MNCTVEKRPHEIFVDIRNKVRAEKNKTLENLHDNCVTTPAVKDLVI